jgi:hypothetical protein
MSFRAADRVKEVTTIVGTGTYILGGTLPGFRTFGSAIGSANRCLYCVENGTDWEINEGVVTVGSPDLLTRARLLTSSTGSAINWSAGTKTVFCVASAADRNPRTRALSADHAVSSAVATEVVGLELTSIQPGTYVVQYYLRCQSVSTSVGLGTGLNFTGVAPNPVITKRYVGTGNLAATGNIDDIATNIAGQVVEGYAARAFETTSLSMMNGGVATNNVDTMVVMEALLTVTTQGNLELWHSSEAAVTTTIMTGSSVILTRIDD